MSELWDKIEDESAKQYTAFCDYRDMGTGRSLRKLFDIYCGNNVDKSGTKPPTVRWNTVGEWSSKFNWVKRCEEWDTEQALQRTVQHQAARKKIIDDELRDYNLQLDKWAEAYKRTPLHERQHRAVSDDGTVTEFIGLNHDDLHRMAKWRDEITKQGRRALGMPEKVTEQHISADVTTSKGYKNVSPDDWDKDE